MKYFDTEIQILHLQYILDSWMCEKIGFEFQNVVSILGSLHFVNLTVQVLLYSFELIGRLAK